MGAFNAYMALSGAFDADVAQDELLSHHTTYRIGGPADLLVTVHSYPALLKTIELLDREGVDWVILGRGSNILASDSGYRGCVIKLGREFSRISFGEEGLVSAGAGALLSKLVNETLSRSLSGIECCVGIPGTVGGAISMDAGTRHDWIGPRVDNVVTLRPGEGLHRYEGSDVDWGYRYTSLPTNEIILEATLRLEPDDKKRIADRMNHLVSRRRLRQPVGKPSCGSVFKNPPDQSVGQLIESCGLKSYAVGGAMVSDKHANFIVNTGGATAADVVSVIRHVHDCVLERHGVDLACEVKLLGFDA
ncbi:MAG: UDP-N-acetylmuramate dehydrogenase [Olsenella sp.]|nr:UDP-N-acetylmuramate dehydrogenase [Olsenella sp.]